MLILFGGKKIPEMMRGLGSGVNEFKKGMAGETDDKKKEEEKKEGEQEKK